MSQSRFPAIAKSSLLAAASLTLAVAFGASAHAQPAQAAAPACAPRVQGSPYIPLDSWVYPAAMRLYSLGYLDRLFLGMRPWTRSSLGRALADSAADLRTIDPNSDREGVWETYQALQRFVGSADEGCPAANGAAQLESTYTLARGLSGQPLRDSFHLGSTLVNDYGRPYERGFNNYSGLSGYAAYGRFQLYARGEFQGAPSASGYSQSLANALAAIDAYSYPATGQAQATIPGAHDLTAQTRFLEAYVSGQLLNHVVSFGKQDLWYGPGRGAGMAFSNNAENFYSFRINRIEPLYVPLLSRLVGPVRYEFIAGPLKGHIYPKDPWFHAEKITLRPLRDLQIGFERSVIWGGEGHTPITLHSFLKSFFSFSAPAYKTPYNDSDDPGARFGAVDFSYRLPFLRKSVTLYADGEVHDDMSPIDAPRRASWRPGVYLSHLPGAPRFDLRLEAVSTDPPVSNSKSGRFMYWEYVEQQGYTNNGQLMGDWVGREGKGGQAWLAYHLSAQERVEASVRHHKVAKDFIAGGTTLNDFSIEAVKRIRKDLELRGRFTLEQWRAPIYLAGRQSVTNTEIGLTWYPERKTSF